MISTDEKVIQLLLDVMDDFSNEERLKVFSKIKSYFCDGCGCKQDEMARYVGGMRCQCQNDEL